MSPIDGASKHVEWAVSVRPASTATSLCPSSSSSLSSSGSATSKRSGISPGKSRRQKFSIEGGERCSCMAVVGREARVLCNIPLHLPNQIDWRAAANRRVHNTQVDEWSRGTIYLCAIPRGTAQMLNGDHMRKNTMANRKD